MRIDTFIELLDDSRLEEKKIKLMNYLRRVIKRLQVDLATRDARINDPNTETVSFVVTLWWQQMKSEH